MRRNYFVWSIIAMSTIAIAGCTADMTEGAETVKTNTKVVTASMESESQTRTAVKDGTPKTIVWATGDQFKVFNETTPTSPATLTLTAGAGTANGTFGGSFMDGNTYQKAVYPADGATLSEDFKTLTMKLPASITWGIETDESADAVKCPIPFYGAYDAEERSVTFKFLTAILKLDFKDMPAGTSKVTVVSKNKAISGTFTAKTTASAPVLASSSTADEDKKLEVNFDALTEKGDKVLYIAIPATTYEKLDVYLEGSYSDKKNIASWENIKFERKKIYTATRTYVEVEAGTPAEVSAKLDAALKATDTNGTIEIVISTPEGSDGIKPADSDDGSTSYDETSKAIEVPQVEGANISLTFEDVPAMGETPLEIKQKDGADGVTSNSLTVAMPDNGSSAVALNIDLPKTTVTLEGTGTEGITYKVITAKTAENTLMVGKGVTITKLNVTGGNVDILNGGTVTDIELAEGCMVKSSDKKGVLTNLTAGAELELDGLTVSNLAMTATDNKVTLNGANTSRVYKLTVNNTGGYTLSRTGSYPLIYELHDGEGAHLSVLDASINNTGDYEAYTMNNDLTINASKTIANLIYKSGTLNNNGTISNLDNQSGSAIGLSYESGFTGIITKVTNGEVNVAYETKTSSDIAKVTRGHGTFNLQNDLEIAGIASAISPVADTGTLNVGTHTLKTTSTSASILIKGATNLILEGEESGGISSASRVVWANQAKASITIKGGTYVSKTSECIYCYTGTVTIEGGTFRSGADPKFLLNCYDKNRNNKDTNQNTGTAKIIVKGGKFYDFNPANNTAEGEGTNFVATGYKVEESKDGEHAVYTVVKENQ